MPCIWPEMPYCPACKYGHIVYFEDSDTECEWNCLCTDDDVAKMDGGKAMERKLIDRGAAIAALTRIGVQVSDSKTRTVAKCVNEIEMLPVIDGVDAGPTWISAKKPPKEWKVKGEDQTLINYLVYMPEYGVDVGNYLEPAKEWVVMGIPAKVTHWMPLPEPPKMDGGENNESE